MQNMGLIWLMIVFVAMVVGVCIVLSCLQKRRSILSLKRKGAIVRKRPFKEIIKQKLNASTIIFSIVFLFLFIYAVMLCFPLVWGLIASLKTGGKDGDWTVGLFALPVNWNVANYWKAFESLKVTEGGVTTTFVEMLFNSVWFSVGSAWISMEFTAAFSYVLNKYKFAGRGFLYGLALFMVSVPIGASMMSTYRLIHGLGLSDSPLILVTAMNVYGMNLILTYSYWTNISWTYAEAAQIDGAGFYYTYFKIMRPQVMPMMLTLAILAFISKWNDYMNPMLYLEKMPTLATGLYRYRLNLERGMGEYPRLFAGMIIGMTPVMIVFAIFSDRLLGKVSMGGIKG